ncbi:E3 ubiquitin-protein ligase rnf13 [Rhizophlyctis rosea]|nr:E3 ubiquitin-protein ligase rnf13 [Rhizophlyctis rosea]
MSSTVQVSWTPWTATTGTTGVKLTLPYVAGSPSIDSAGFSYNIYNLGSACRPLPYDPTQPSGIIAYVPLDTSCTLTAQFLALESRYPFPPKALLFVSNTSIDTTGVKWFAPALQVGDVGTATMVQNAIEMGVMVTLMPDAGDGGSGGKTNGLSHEWYYITIPLVVMFLLGFLGAWWFLRRVVAQNRALIAAENLELRNALGIMPTNSEGQPVLVVPAKTKIVLDPSAVDALPLRTHIPVEVPHPSEEMKEKDAGTSEGRAIPVTTEDAPDPLCAICIENYVAGDRVRDLPCGHAYHQVCIDPWLTTESAECPLCKAVVVSASSVIVTVGHVTSGSSSGEVSPLPVAPAAALTTGV